MTPGNGFSFDLCPQIFSGAILGIVTEDDDAEGAMGRLPDYGLKTKPRSVEQMYPEVFIKKPATREQMDRLEIFRKAGRNIKA